MYMYILCNTFTTLCGRHFVLFAVLYTYEYILYKFSRYETCTQQYKVNFRTHIVRITSRLTKKKKNTNNSNVELRCTTGSSHKRLILTKNMTLIFFYRARHHAIPSSSCSVVSPRRTRPATRRDRRRP